MVPLSSNGLIPMILSSLVNQTSVESYNFYVTETFNKSAVCGRFLDNHGYFRDNYPCSWEYISLHCHLSIILVLKKGLKSFKFLKGLIKLGTLLNMKLSEGQNML